MKKMTRLLLINWHYFEHQLIDFEDINFLTGKNSSGKSTIIDALQVVLMGETRSSAFNRAASKKSERTLKSYLIGSKGEDIADGKQSVRGGKDFTSYIVAEFYDDVKDNYFCLGAVFDSFSDGGDEKRRFFYLKAKLPENHFIVDNRAINIKQMTLFFKEKYPNKFETKDTNDGYQQLLLAKISVYEKKWFSMLKKAISFEPINDIEKFITDSVCDISDDIRITDMKENILYYKQQEDIAEKFEEKLKSLEEICGLYTELERLKNLLKKQSFLIDFGRMNDLSERLETARREAEKYDSDIAEFSRDYQILDEKLTVFDREKEALIAEKQRFLSESGMESLKAEQSNCEREINNANSLLGRFITSTKTSAIRWEGLVKTAVSGGNLAVENDEASRLSGKLSRLEKLCEADFEKLSVKYFSDVRNDFFAVKSVFAPIQKELDNKCTVLEQKTSGLKAEIAKLKSGIKAFPAKDLQFKKLISDELKRLYGVEVSVEFFADLIDVSDEEWHNAVEGYLNTQRMDLIIEPRYFNAAYQIYKKAHLEHNVHGCRIIDTESVLAAQRYVVPNSLADVVSSENKYAAAYAKHLLGGVSRCFDDDKIRDNRTSITKDCMLYKNFAVSGINREIYGTPYIGVNSIKKQLENKTRELAQTEAELAQKAAAKNAVSPLIESEWFLSEGYISSAVESAFSHYENKLFQNKKLAEIQDKLDKIDFFWVDEMDRKIAAKNAEISVTISKKEETSRFIDEFKREKDERVSRLIPWLEQQIAESDKQISACYEGEYIDGTGLQSYNQELAARGTAAAVVAAFESPRRATETLLNQQFEKVVKARGEYNRVQQVSFDFNCKDNNDDYDNEYAKIKDYELPKYKERIEKARNDAMEQFKSDFMYKLKNNIETAVNRIAELNQALKKARFGNDSYRFEVRPNPAYHEYYEMIMSDLLISGDNDLFSYEFLSKYQSTIDNLFAQIISFSGDEKAAQLIELFSKYKTYLTFDMLSTDANGKTERLSSTIFTKSGGETQTPFYVAVLASFAQIYHIYDNDDSSNTLRLVIFDEAFNKMDSERIVESIKLLKRFKLQAIICSPPEKAVDIAPLADRTLFVFKENYNSTVFKWTKDTEELLYELSI